MDPIAKYECIKIYLTGFGPFQGITNNPTEELVLSIINNNNIFNTSKCTFVSGDIFAVDTCFVDEHLPILHKVIKNNTINCQTTKTLSVLIHFGLNSKSKEFNIEYQATNYIKDEYKQSVILKDSKQLYLNTTLNCESILQRLNEKGYKYTLSHNAGKYLCNYIYFLSLNYFMSSNNIIVVFIHIPEHSIMTLEENQKLFKALIESLEEIYC